jgi:hypothetical protein
MAAGATIGALLILQATLVVMAVTVGEAMEDGQHITAL